MAKTPKERPADPEPTTTYTAIESEILGEIERARKKWGETLELKIIIGNWGDIYDDERMLETIRSFSQTGGYYSNVSALVEEARDEFVQADGDCREIIVVPPIDQAFDDAALHARIGAALTEEFPQYAWRVTVDGPPRDDAFVLIPLLGDPEAGGLLRAPPREVLRDVGAFLFKTFAQPLRRH